MRNGREHNKQRNKRLGWPPCKLAKLKKKYLIRKLSLGNSELGESVVRKKKWSSKGS